LFSKSELIYGLDRARHAAADAGCLVVVEGYTDVLMAHQAGVDHVVATMGTALNGKHVQQLSRHTNRVVLVFDADAGGLTGVDRALELFVSQDVELAIATLPEGLDPCDLIVKDGPEPFLQAISAARDALDFKLEQVLAREAGNGIAGQKRAFDAVLGIMALAPQLPGQAGTIKQQLIVGRIARRLGLREETIWARLGELRDLRRLRDRHVSEEPARSAPSKAPEIERQLLEVLLAEPLLVARARTAIALDEVTHPEVRELLAGLYALDAAGEPADLDGLRLNLDARQATAALRLQEIGRQNPDRTLWFGQVLAAFHERRSVKKRQTLQTQLAATGDHEAAVALLRRLQDQSVGSDR
jgi:DNA primase